MKMFQESFKEFKDLRAVLVTGLLVSLSMVIESFSLNLGFAKINFAFLAIAAIGMLYGPSVSLCAGAVCDILGFLVKPDGAFFPLYTLIGAAQGLIYGIIAYRKLSNKTGKSFDIEMIVRLIIARVVDVVFIKSAADAVFRAFVLSVFQRRKGQNICYLVDPAPFFIDGLNRLFRYDGQVGFGRGIHSFMRKRSVRCLT